VAAAHEERRGAILQELQMLAARMGTLPRPRAPFTTLETAPVPEAPQNTEPCQRSLQPRLTLGQRPNRLHGLHSGKP
jgi:hypothetical protein